MVLLKKETPYGMPPGGCKGNFIGFVFLIVFTIAALFLTGCYTEQKAAEQTGKAATVYPQVVAKIARDKWPCTTTDSTITEKFDSTEFKKQLAAANDKRTAAEKRADSLKKVIATLSPDVQLLCKDFQEIINDQGGEIARLNEFIAGIKPVIKIKEVTKTVEDPAKIFLANRERDDAVTEKLRAQAGLSAEKKKNDELLVMIGAYKKKHSGKIEILIPWWVLVALALLVGLGLRFKLFSKAINLFK